MRKGLFSKLAVDNLGRNRRFYIPHILTEAGMLACFYITLTLYSDDRLAEVHGGSYIPFFMTIGLTVISILSVIIILYSNGFLMKQRRQEFGLYNALGMEKRHIGRILFVETALSNLIAIGAGIGIGILLYKLCSVVICNLLNAEIIAGVYYISADTILISILSFIVLDIVVFVVNRISLSRKNAVDLIAGNNAGEREPKIKWPLFIIGVICLGGGYYLSVTTTSPLQALYMFFVAVVLVVVGTYCVFVSGSIFILKCLKKNKKYYYNKAHMTTVSGLMYRMKHNAVGLASIALLATCVLVLISTTISLYSGMEQTIDVNYPQHMYVSAGVTEDGVFTYQVPSDVLKDITVQSAEDCGVEISDIDENNYLDVAYVNYDGVLLPEANMRDDEIAANLVNITYVTQDEYEKITNIDLGLKDGEIVVSPITTYLGDAGIQKGPVTIGNQQYEVKEIMPSFPIQNYLATIVTCYGIVLPSDADMQAVYDDQKEVYGDYASEYNVRVAVMFSDYEKASKNGENMSSLIEDSVKDYIAGETGSAESAYVQVDYKWEASDNIYGMYGTLLFLGIILGIVFLFATVLIIYYKQISEGYDDRERFQIMKKIGMSDLEVKKTIGRQIIYVFFIPLAAAVINVLFAFPMLTKLLNVLLLSSTWLFVGCTAATVGVFALVYIIIYSLTARIYYKIVK